MKNLSIVIPCYNEGFKLITNIQKIRKYMMNNLNNINYDIIVVIDGCTDDSLELLEDSIENQLFEDCPVKIISYKYNKGKGYAIKKGIESSTGDIVCFMDADLSTNLESLKEALSYTDSYDIVIGSRRHPDSVLSTPQRLPRKFIGKSCSIITNIITSLGILDTQCGFKVFDGDVSRNIIEKQTINGFAFDVELLYIAKNNGFGIKEIPVTWDNDEDSKVSVIKSSILFMKDLIYIRLNRGNYID